MKITITYTEEQKGEAINALKINSWHCALWDFDQYLRSECKYNDKRTESEIDLIYEIREKLHEYMHENTISFNE